MLHNSASGPEMVLGPDFGRILVGKASTSLSGRPSAGRADFAALPIRIRPKSGPKILVFGPEAQVTNIWCDFLGTLCYAIVLPGRISAGVLLGKRLHRPSGWPKAGRRADLGVCSLAKFRLGRSMSVPEAVLRNRRNNKQKEKTGSSIA